MPLWWVEPVLWLTFFVALAGVFVLSWVDPALVPVLPGLAVLLLAGAALFRYPVANLCVLLFGSILLLNPTEGLQAEEIVYGLYLVAFLAYWYFNEIVVHRRKLIESPVDGAILVFVIVLPLTLVLTMLYGGSVRSAMSEYAALLMLWLFFPIRELVRRHPAGIRVMLLLLVLLGCYAALRNGYMYQQRIANAEYVFQVTRGRIMLNDGLLMISSLFLLGLVGVVRSFRLRMLVLGGLVLTLAGLVMTQSRGYWVAFAMGSFVALLLTPGPERRQTIKWGAIAVLMIGGAGLLLMGDLVLIIASGLIERLTSVGSATTRDLSFISRVIEWQGAFERIRTNPVLGHGLGVSYSYYDVISRTTVDRIFVHNGYVGLLFRFGIWGFALAMFWWIGSIIRGVLSLRGETPRLHAAAVRLSVASLVAMLFSMITSNPLFLSDSVLVLTALTGIIAGVGAMKKDSTRAARSGNDVGPPDS